jgi:hypothetical protein
MAKKTTGKAKAKKNNAKAGKKAVKKAGKM